MDTATLRDVTASPNPAAATAPPEPVKTDPAPVVDLSNKDATTLGQMLLDSGYTADNINDLLSSPQALASLRWQIENDPVEFVKGIERANPSVGERFSEKLTDLYIQRHGANDPAKGSTTASKEVPTELMAEVSMLKEKLAGFETREEARNRAATVAQTQSRYTARVDDLFATQGIKDLNLTKSQVAGMRALLDKDLASDPSAVQRVSAGNFIDVPRRFQAILNDWVADQKAAIDSEKTARERASKNASPFVLDGPNPFSLENVPTSTFDSWDNTEAGFADALKKLAASGQ